MSTTSSAFCSDVVISPVAYVPDFPVAGVLTLFSLRSDAVISTVVDFDSLRVPSPLAVSTISAASNNAAISLAGRTVNFYNCRKSSQQSPAL